MKDEGRRMKDERPNLSIYGSSSFRLHPSSLRLLSFAACPAYFEIVT
jgi:hypothetical protein